MIIGITGNIGCGKSSFAQRLNQKASTSKSVLIDADQIARQVSSKNHQYRSWLKERFGDSIFSGTELNRKKLGSIVFSNPIIRLEIENAIRPHIRKQLYHECENAQKHANTILVEAALIYEWQHSEFYNIIIAVVADIDVSLQRAAKRLDVSTTKIAQRYSSQFSQFHKAKLSDLVVFNDGSLTDLYSQADFCWKNWLSKL